MRRHMVVRFCQNLSCMCITDTAQIMQLSRADIQGRYFSSLVSSSTLIGV